MIKLLSDNDIDSYKMLIISLKELVNNFDIKRIIKIKGRENKSQNKLVFQNCSFFIDENFVDNSIKLNELSLLNSFFSLLDILL